jgi:hypothetical protein
LVPSNSSGQSGLSVDFFFESFPHYFSFESPRIREAHRFCPFSKSFEGQSRPYPLAAFLGMGDKYFAIPWNAFHFNLKENRAVLNVDKKLLENAPGFDKANWPNFTDSTWGNSIYNTMATPLTGKKSPAQQARRKTVSR